MAATLINKFNLFVADQVSRIEFCDQAPNAGPTLSDTKPVIELAMSTADLAALADLINKTVALHAAKKEANG